MDNCRILIISDHPLFAQGVERLINGQGGLHVVGIVLPDQASAAILALQPDVVIADADRATQATFSRMLRENPGVKFIALSLDHNDINIYYQRSKASNGVEALIEAIREPLEWKLPEHPRLRLLVVAQGSYGQRIADHIRRQAPVHWIVNKWSVPTWPPDSRDPRELLPEALPTVELVLSLGQSPQMTALLPGIAQMTNAKSMIVPICDAAWLPSEHVAQLRKALATLNVTCIFPKPFCSLTETLYNAPGHQIHYQDGPILEFARHFGEPAWSISVDADSRTVRDILVLRDSPCGCGQYVAEALLNVPLAEAEQQAQSAYGQFPCPASQVPDADYAEPLVQVSRDILNRALRSQLAQMGTRQAV